MTLLVFISISFSIVISLFAPQLIFYLFGESFSGAADVLVIHCWAGIFVCLGISSGSVLAAKKQLHWNLYRNLFGLSINIILNILLISSYGVRGAAIATLISLACAFCLFDLFSQSTRYMFFDKLKSFNIFWLINRKHLSHLHQLGSRQ
jgi:O-antigen/teichoic acid export membrane protein